MSENQEPKIGESGIPLWIKMMWVCGVAWVVTYIFLGLRSVPMKW
jgi:hypothetical protein